MSGGLRSSPLPPHHMAESTSANSSAKRLADECETTRSRLQDQRFSMRNYHDPLRPREKDTSKSYPQGVTHEMEQAWLKMINDSKQ